MSLGEIMSHPERKQINYMRFWIFSSFLKTSLPMFTLSSLKLLSLIYLLTTTTLLIYSLYIDLIKVKEANIRRKTEYCVLLNIIERGLIAMKLFVER